MNALQKSLLLLAVLVAVGAGIVFLLNAGNGEGPPVDLHTSQVADDDTEPADTLAGGNYQIPVDDPVEPVQRTEVNLSRDPSDYAQGIRGRVVDPTGNAVPATKLFLMEAAGMDLFRQLMLANKGVRFPPVAKSETAEDGSFAIGLDTIDPTKRYELRVVSDRFVDQSVPSITVHQSKWADLGTLTLEHGITVYGRVTIENSGGLPVPNAEVAVKPTTYQPSVSPTPGRENGLLTKVDHTGTFRLDNVPPGVVHISAVAPGYAKIEKQNITVQASTDNQVLFELPTGVGIRGVVTDSNGVPIPDARIEATAISSKSPSAANTTTDRSGRFNVIGLINGSYLVSAVAPGFVRWQLQPVPAGDENLHVVLEKQGTARIRAYDKNGRVLKSFRVTVKTYYEGQEQFGNTEIPPAQARANTDGFAIIEGLDPGQYVLQVQAKGHCKAFSDPFTIAVASEAPTVEVHLDEGGSIEGVVTDNRGQPVAGVSVETVPNSFDENPFTIMFKGIIPFKITKKKAKTNARGVYRLSLLNPGSYQLKVTHPEFYTLFIKDNEVTAGQVTKVRTLKMERGTVISGEARVDGTPTGQIKITISATPDPENPNPVVFNCEAISDNQGNFVISKRVPPGRYQIMAARQTLPNPLMQIADYHKTKQEIVLGQGQEKYFHTVNISSK